MYSGFQSDIGRLIEIFHETGAIQFGDYVFAGGNHSNNKIDVDFVLKNEEGAEIIGRLVSSKILELEEMNGKEYEIAGVARGGAKVAELAAGVLGRDYASLNHKNGEVIGELYPDEYVICEDVTTKASSIINCYNMFVVPKKATVKHTIAVADRNEGAVKNLSDIGIEHEYFLTKEQLGVYENSYPMPLPS